MFANNLRHSYVYERANLRQLTLKIPFQFPFEGLAKNGNKSGKTSHCCRFLVMIRCL